MGTPIDHNAAPPLKVFEDNTGAKALAENYTYILTKRSRHFRVRLAYVKQQLMDGVMFIEYINTHDNIADLFTKFLPVATHWKHLRELGLRRFSEIFGYEFPSL